MENIDSLLRDIIGKWADISVDISADEDLTIYGINSISFIKIVVEIEKVFGFEFDEEELDYAKYNTLDKLIFYVKSKL